MFSIFDELKEELLEKIIKLKQISGAVLGKLPPGKFPPISLNIPPRIFNFFFIIATVITDTT